MAKAEESAASSIIDYVSVIISPVLIMGMLISLVFFLIDVLYGGNYSERLSYTMFFYVFAAVLIARISIQYGTARAMAYVFGLGIVTFIVMLYYVTYPTPLMQSIGPLINIGLMVMVSWCASKLTWDCTHLDGERDAGGQGLLAASGIATHNSESINPYETAEVSELDQSTLPGVKKKKKKTKQQEGFYGWLERLKEYREAQKKKPHTPGTWIIYFGLAAIPIFIVGQSLIPAEDEFRRRWTFFEMAGFVGCGLGLLVTTSLMGLKKYLQDRGAKIPGAMTGSWLLMGAAMIISFLVIGAFLPRPYSETPLVKMPKWDTSERDASNNAVIKDRAAGKGEGAEGEKQEAGDGQNISKGGKAGAKQGQGEKKGGGENKGQSGSQSNQKGEQKGGEQNGGDQKGGEQKGGEQKGGEQKGEQKGREQKENQKNQQGQQKNEGQKQNEQSQSGSQSQAEKNKSQDKQSSQQQQQQEQEQKQSVEKSQSQFSPMKMFESVSSVIKWIVWVVLAIGIIAGIVIFFLKYLSPFTSWARGLLDWLMNLFGVKEKEKSGPAVAEEKKVEKERLPPFDSFSNPFKDGSSKGKPVPQLVKYTYNAFESWAADQNLDRLPGETSDEFANRVCTEFPKLESSIKLVSLLNRVAYSDRVLPADSVETMKKIWAEMGT